jgi:hypothetical protein
MVTMYSSEDISNAILTGIVKTLEIMKDIKSQGDDLNDVDYPEVIEMRLRDMTDRGIYNCTNEADNNEL